MSLPEISGESQFLQRSHSVVPIFLSETNSGFEIFEINNSLSGLPTLRLTCSVARSASKREMRSPRISGPPAVRIPLPIAWRVDVIERGAFSFLNE